MSQKLIKGKCDGQRDWNVSDGWCLADADIGSSQRNVCVVHFIFKRGNSVIFSR